MKNKLTNRCPICGKTATQYTTKYHTKTFVFCSAICLSTFDNNLLLYATENGAEAKPLLKRRKLCLAEPCPPETMQLIEHFLQNLVGLVSVANEKNCLIVNYDLLQVTQARIEGALKEIDVALNESWPKKLCRSWTHRMEKIELANVTAD